MIRFDEVTKRYIDGTAPMSSAAASPRPALGAGGHMIFLSAR
jgi:hypothetical protein